MNILSQVYSLIHNLYNFDTFLALNIKNTKSFISPWVVEEVLLLAQSLTILSLPQKLLTRMTL